MRTKLFLGLGSALLLVVAVVALAGAMRPADSPTAQAAPCCTECPPCCTPDDCCQDCSQCSPIDCCEDWIACCLAIGCDVCCGDGCGDCCGMTEQAAVPKAKAAEGCCPAQPCCGK